MPARKKRGVKQYHAASIKEQGLGIEVKTQSYKALCSQGVFALGPQLSPLS